MGVENTGSDNKFISERSIRKTSQLDVDIVYVYKTAPDYKYCEHSEANNLYRIFRYSRR